MIATQVERLALVLAVDRTLRVGRPAVHVVVTVPHPRRDHPITARTGLVTVIDPRVEPLQTGVAVERLHEIAARRQFDARPGILHVRQRRPDLGVSSTCCLVGVGRRIPSLGRDLRGSA